VVDIAAGVDAGGEVVGFPGPGDAVSVGDGRVGQRIFVGGHVRVDRLGLEFLVSRVGEGSGDVVAESVEALIPDSVKLISLVVVWDGEGIATDVTGRVGVVEARLGVHGLMDVTEVVDEETERIRFSDIGVARVESVVDVIVDVRVKVVVAVLLTDPGDDLGDRFGDVSGGDFG